MTLTLYLQTAIYELKDVQMHNNIQIFFFFQRCVSKKVDESIFFRLVQYFAVMLFECNEAEDYVPAKTLMNMCFTFYHECKWLELVA